jgi:hypothetical protein
VATIPSARASMQLLFSDALGAIGSTAASHLANMRCMTARRSAPGPSADHDGLGHLSGAESSIL